MSGAGTHHYYVRIRGQREDNMANKTMVAGGSIENLMTASSVERISGTVLDRNDSIADFSREYNEKKYLVQQMDESRQRRAEPSKATWGTARSVLSPQPRTRSIDLLEHGRPEKSDYDIYGHQRRRPKDYPPGPEILTKLKVGGHARNAAPGHRIPSHSAEWLEISCEEELEELRQRTVITGDSVMTEEQVVEVDISQDIQIERSSGSLSAESIHTIDSKSVTATAGSEQETAGPAVSLEETIEVDGGERDISSYVRPSVIAKEELALRANQLMTARTEEEDGAMSVDYSQSLEVVFGSSVDLRYEKEEPPCTCDVATAPTVDMETKVSTVTKPYSDKQTVHVISGDKSRFSSEYRQSKREDFESLDYQKVQLRDKDDQMRLHMLRKFLQDEQGASAPLKDLSVSADGKTFTTCRLLMAALSHYVRELCEQEKLHTHTNLVIEGITADSLRVLLEWIEMSTVTLTPDIVHDVFRAATMLRVDSLSTKCNHYLTTMQQMENVELAQLDGTTEVTTDESHREDHNAILDYSVECLCHWLICEGASGDVRQVYDVACAWLKHRWSERKKYEARVMDCIDFGRFSADQLRELLSVELDPLVQRPLIKEKLISALLDFLSVNAAARTVSEVSEKAPCPRHDMKSSQLSKTEAATKIQAGYRGYRHRKTMEKKQEAASNIQKIYRGYRTRSNIRQQNEAAAVIQTGYVKFMSSRRRQLLYETLRKQNRANWTSQISSREVFVSLSTIFLCFGGVSAEPATDAEDPASQIFSFEVNKDKWSLIGALPEPRSEMAACLLGSRIYIIGGYNPEQSGDRMSLAGGWSWELDTGYWNDVADMLEARRLHHLVVVGGKLYAIGGCSASGSVLASVESYDPSTNQWSSSVPLEVPRYAAAVTVHNGNIWACGGVVDVEANGTRKITDRVDVFQPLKNKWSKYKCLPAPRAFADAASINSMLYVVGGVEFKQDEGVVVSPVVLASELRSDSDWRHLTDLRCPRYKAIAISRDPYLVVIGGEKCISGPPLTTVECFDTEDEQWLALPDLPVALRGSCAIAV